MAASSQLITDLGTVITNGPSTTTQANSIAAAGPIMDYKGNCDVAQLKLKEAEVLLASVKVDTDSTDSTNLTLINAILAALNGTGGPSTTLLTDIASVITNGPNSATAAKAIAAAGRIMDYIGNCKQVQLMLKEAKVLITAIHANTASSDDSTNQGLLADILTALA